MLSHVSLLIGGFRTCHFYLAQVLLKFSPSWYQLQLASSRLLLEDSEVQFWAVKQRHIHPIISCLLAFIDQAIFFTYDTHLHWVNRGKSSITGIRIPLAIFPLTILAIVFLNQIEFCISGDCTRIFYL